MTRYLLFLFLISCGSARKQADTVRDRATVHDTIAAAVDSVSAGNEDPDIREDRKRPKPLPLEPTFPSGKEGLKKFIESNVIMPEAAEKAGVNGVVQIVFTVKKDGSLEDFRVFRGLGYGCDEEALRVAKLMPRWNPGKQEGKVVDMQYNIIVLFGR